MVVSVDGRRLTRTGDLADLIGRHGPGDKVELEVVRDGKRRTVTVTLGKRPEKPPEGGEPRCSSSSASCPWRCASRCCPSLGSHAARAHEEGAAAAGGDVTFAIDAAAEQMLERSWSSARPTWPSTPRTAAWWSPSGGPARAVLVVDPIDGTRPALAGLESCCVSVAAAPAGGRAHDRRRVGGLRGGDPVRPGVPGRPRARSGRVPAGAAERERADRPDVLDLRLPRPAGAGADRGDRRADRRLVGGRRHVRPGLGGVRHDTRGHRPARLRTWSRGRGWWTTCPGMRAEFERVGGGAVLNNSPYDVAASVLVSRRRARWSPTPTGPPGRASAAGLGCRVPDVRGVQRQPRTARPDPCRAGRWREPTEGEVDSGAG